MWGVGCRVWPGWGARVEEGVALGWNCHPDRSEAERRDLTGVDSRLDLNLKA